jgi:hypothetical protein
MAGASASAASLRELVGLAANVGDAAARQRLQAAALRMLLGAGAARPAGGCAPGEQLLQNLLQAVSGGSQGLVAQLRQAAGAALPAADAAAKEAAVAAVRLCYRRIQAFASGRAADAPPEGSSIEPGGLDAVAAALLVLGPLSGSNAAEGAAEARLLVDALRKIAQAGIAGSGGAQGSDTRWSGALCRLLQCLSLALCQLSTLRPASESSGGYSGDDTQEDPNAVQGCTSALCRAAIPALHAVLLSPAARSRLVRGAALEAAAAMPAFAQAPLRLLRGLAVAAGGVSRARAAAELLLPAEGLQARLQLDADEGLLLVALPGSTAEPAGAEARGEEAGQQQGAQRIALLALFDLLGSMAGTYQQQKAAFLQQLRSNGDGGGGHGHRSKAGRQLRPAAEWWVAERGGPVEQQEQGAGGAEEGPTEVGVGPQPVPAAAAGAGASQLTAAQGDYMQREDEAAKHAAAAQRFLESLLAAADAPPACFLPLLERLAGSAAAPADVQVRTSQRAPACAQDSLKLW